MGEISDYKRIVLRSVTYVAAILLFIYVVLQIPDFTQKKIKYNEDDWTMTKNTYIQYDTLSSTRMEQNQRKKVTLTDGEKIKPIAREVNALGRTYWIQVENEKGDRGFVYVDDINSKVHPLIHQIPKIRSGRIHPTTYETFSKNVLGKDIRKVEKRYGPAMSNIPVTNGREAYFRHVSIVKQGSKYSGVFLKLDENNKVKEIEFDRSLRYAGAEKFPLAQALRKIEFFGIAQSVYHYREGGIVAGIANFFRSLARIHWTTKIIGFLVSLFIFFLIYSIPRLLVHPFSLLILYYPGFSNGVAKAVIVTLSAFVFYIYVVFIGISDGSIWIHLIFVFFVFIFWRSMDLTNIAYNRCPKCRSMGKTYGEGSTHKGRTKEVSHGHRDVYKGKRETETEIIHNYERINTRTNKIYDWFDDHRCCSMCESRWNVIRKILKSSVVQDV